MAAYVPDHQWELLQQSLKEHHPVGPEGAAHADVPTDVVVEAGILVRTTPYPVFTLYADTARYIGRTCRCVKGVKL